MECERRVDRAYFKQPWIPAGGGRKIDRFFRGCYPHPGLVNLAEQADIFICECSFPGDGASSDHLAAGQVGWLAQVAGVKRLVLVHLYPPALKVDLISLVREEYSGQAEIATDGLALSL